MSFDEIALNTTLYKMKHCITLLPPFTPEAVKQSLSCVLPGAYDEFGRKILSLLLTEHRLVCRPRGYQVLHKLCKPEQAIPDMV